MLGIETSDWHDKLKRRDVTFSVRDYRTVGGWALSMNGSADGEDFVPEIYDERYALPNGTSAVRRLGGLETPSVTDSLFVRSTAPRDERGSSAIRR